MNKSILSLLCLFVALTASAQSYFYDLTKPQPRYSETQGYGYDVVESPTAKSNAPFYFSVKVPDGNYRVTVVLGSKKKAGETMVRAEARRMMTGKVVTRKGKTETVSFIVNKRDVNFVNAKGEAQKVLIKPGEVGSMTWDEKLTLEFNGAAPCVQSIAIEPDTTATTLYLCGNSTVVDQRMEPWASWGQMVTMWFDDKISVANYAESGLTAATFLAQKRLDKILTMLRKGDYVFCEFGHNDEKEKGPGTGAWYHYSVNLKKFVDMVREKGGNIIFCTPTQRRFFEGKKIRNTHGEFPDAMRAVAQREGVQLIEINGMTTEMYETMGEEDSKHLLVHYPLGSFPWQDRKFEDNTHYNPFGAYEVSKCIVMGLKKLNSPLVARLKPIWEDFNPAQPDDWKTFYWPLSPLFDGKKPDGN